MISRTAYKDGGSHYCLDNQKKPFREIAALLRESGVDLDHNRFLILQVYSCVCVCVQSEYERWER